jgi:o-succinylbenzoate---CoA ligase
VATPSLTPFDDGFWCDTRAIALEPAPTRRGPPEWLADHVAAGLVFFRTSGSEARPKWVGLSREALLASARAVNAFLGVTDADVWLRTLPAHHVAGFGVEARAWAARARLVRGEGKWNAERFVETCACERITLTSLVPAQVFDLVGAEIPAPRSLRAVVVGAGELRPSLFYRGRRLGWPLLTSYGLTEAGSQVATLFPGEEDPARLTLLPHWQASLSEDRCLKLRGPALATCYFSESPDGRWRRSDIGGQLTTADRTTLEETPDGTKLRFLGRRDRVVKILGELVDLDAIDSVVADAAIELSAVGRVRLRCEPAGRAGHRLVLECLEKATGEELVGLIAGHLPPVARGTEVRVVADLRLSELGKPVL